MTKRCITVLALVFFLPALLSVPVFAEEQKASGPIPCLADKNSGDTKLQADLEYMLGYQSEIYNKWEDALSSYSRALACDPPSSYLGIQVARMLFKLGRIEEATLRLEDILKQDPVSVSAMMYLGELYNVQKRVDEAILLYERVLKVEPDKTESLLFLGVLYASKQDFEKGQACFDRVLAKEPENLLAMYYLGTLYIEKKNYKAAEAQFKKIVEINPNFYAAYLNLGLISEARGNPKSAEGYYNKALALNPQNLYIRERLAQLYISGKSYDKAVKELEEIARNIPNVDIHFKLGMLYLQEKEFDKAASEFRIVTSARPSDILSRYYLALTLDELKLYEEALIQLKKILQYDPRHLNAFLSMAFIYVKQERLADAAKVYEEVLSFDQSRGEIFAELGNIYIQAKDYRKAEEILNRGLSFFRDNAEPNFAMAVLFEKTGKADQMFVFLKRTIELNPKHADALNFLGYSYADKGINLEEALSLIQRALELKPGSGYIIDSLGWVYFKLGKLDEALKQLKRSLETVKDDPVLYEHLGDVYEALGQQKDALDAWNNSIKYHAKEEGLKARVEEKISKQKNIRRP